MLVAIERRLEKLEQKKQQEQTFLPIWPEGKCIYTKNGMTPDWMVATNVPLDAAHFGIAHEVLNAYKRAAKA